ncbi:MAG: hypothetical protein K5779_01665 [Saccharofermentans sp.]|nr:hypothetical protein [Saccharofermentans sp.]
MKRLISLLTIISMLLGIVSCGRRGDTGGETVALLERLRNAKDHIQIGIEVEDYYRIKDIKKRR